MTNKFDPQILVDLKEKYLDKGITSTKLIAHLMGRSTGTICHYMRMLRKQGIIVPRRQGFFNKIWK